MADAGGDYIDTVFAVAVSISRDGQAIASEVLPGTRSYTARGYLGVAQAAGVSGAVAPNHFTTKNTKDVALAISH